MGVTFRNGLPVGSGISSGNLLSDYYFTSNSFDAITAEAEFVEHRVDCGAIVER